jgi:hypothetical protein
MRANIQKYTKKVYIQKGRGGGGASQIKIHFT